MAYSSGQKCGKVSEYSCVLLREFSGDTVAIYNCIESIPFAGVTPCVVCRGMYNWRRIPNCGAWNVFLEM